MSNSSFIFSLVNRIPIIAVQEFKDEVSLTTSSLNLTSVLCFFKKHVNCQFSLLSCISGVDLLQSNFRFAVIYDILSLKFNSRLRVKVFLNELGSVPSVIGVYKNANWWEREVWDMFGIYFEKHPDLRRILTDYGFEGYPLRKDFPLTGYFEARYDGMSKKVVMEALELSQEQRQPQYGGRW